MSETFLSTCYFYLANSNNSAFAHSPFVAVLIVNLCTRICITESQSHNYLSRRTCGWRSGVDSSWNVGGAEVCVRMEARTMVRAEVRAWVMTSNVAGPLDFMEEN